MITVGIDPGLHGAVALVGEEKFTVIYDTPTIEVKGKTKKLEYLVTEMAAILQRYSSQDCHVFIEKVGAMPGQGVTSMFNFGKGFGIWLGILGTLRIPYTFVTPQAWKKELMEGERDKDASRLVAQRLFPELTDKLNRKKDVGRADALLIAEYGRRKLNGRR